MDAVADELMGDVYAGAAFESLLCGKGTPTRMRLKKRGPLGYDLTPYVSAFDARARLKLAANDKQADRQTDHGQHQDKVNEVEPDRSDCDEGFHGFLLIRFGA